MSCAVVGSHPEILDSRVEIPEHAVFRRFAADTVALNIATGEYYGLDAPAGRMLEALIESGGVRQAAESLAAHDTRPFDEVAAGLCELCISLDRRGLIALRAMPSEKRKH